MATTVQVNKETNEHLTENAVEVIEDLYAFRPPEPDDREGARLALDDTKEQFTQLWDE